MMKHIYTAVVCVYVVFIVFAPRHSASQLNTIEKVKNA